MSTPNRPGLLKHALAVEACMEAYGEQQAAARGLSGDEASALIETYRITGLLHDFDYEKYPSAAEHPFVGNKILAEQGWPEEIRVAIMGHAQYSGVPRNTHLAKALFACDELAGFLTAVSLVKPTKSIFDVDVQSVRKKLKDKAFARGVHREDIIQGAQELGVDLDTHIAFCIAALRRHAAAAGPRWRRPRRPLGHNHSPSAAEAASNSPAIDFAWLQRCRGDRV